MKKILLVIGLLLLFGGEMLRVYFIMPFPGSQETDTIHLAYFLHNNLVYVRILGLLLITSPVYKVFGGGIISSKILLGIVLLLYIFIFYLFNFRFLADKMFYQPRNKNFVSVAENKIALDKLVIGVVSNGEARAYPLEIIGYHHQVQDTIGSEAVMITYCTVCRTGRVYSPFVNGRKENFRLVGMNHFNAMFEDATTKSWWMQATGEAIVGPLNGTTLHEVPSEQMTLAAWLHNYPNSFILQLDTNFSRHYDHLRALTKEPSKAAWKKEIQRHGSQNLG